MSDNKNEKKRCAGTKADGTPCKAWPMKGKECCVNHQLVDDVQAATAVKKAKEPKTAATEDDTDEVPDVDAPTSKGHKYVMPPIDKDLDQKCDALKKDGKQCTRDAKRRGDPNLPATAGKAYCTQHHPGAHGEEVKRNTSGKSSGQKKCSHNTKAGKQCSRNAYGVDGEGKPACSQHGGPTKGGASGTKAAKGVTSSRPTGPLANCDVLVMMDACMASALNELEPHAHTLDVGDEDEPILVDPLAEALGFLARFMRMFAGEKPDSAAIQSMLAAAAFQEDDHWNDHFDHCLVWYLDEFFGREKIQWLLNYFQKYSTVEGEHQAAVKALWETIVSHLNIILRKEEPKEQKKTEAKQLSSGKVSAKATKIKELLAAKAKATKAAAKKHIEATAACDNTEQVTAVQVNVEIKKPTEATEKPQPASEPEQESMEVDDSNNDATGDAEATGFGLDELADSDVQLFSE